MYFNVLNGVRQGRVLSPKLFAIYIDDLSQNLAMCKSGCYIIALPEQSQSFGSKTTCLVVVQCFVQ